MATFIQVDAIHRPFIHLKAPSSSPTREPTSADPPPQSLLSNPAAWDVLSPADRAEILSLFPGGEHVLESGTAAARPDILSLRNDDTFRHDCAAYTENLSEGRFDPGWLECAWSAHERRKIGDFDEHLAEKFEEDWGLALPEEYRPKREGVKREDVGNGEDERGVEEGGCGAGAGEGVNGHESNGSETEKASTHEKDGEEMPSQPQNGVNDEGLPAIDEEDNPSPPSNNEGQEKGPEDAEPMAVDELQDNGAIEVKRATPASMKRKRHRLSQRDEAESEDELA